MIALYSQIGLTLIGISCLITGMITSSRGTVVSATHAIRLYSVAVACWVICAGILAVEPGWIGVTVYGGAAVAGAFTIRSAQRTRESLRRVAELRAQR